MTKKELLIDEIDHISENLIDEVIDFVQFLKAKKINESIDITIASESSLIKDWSSYDEDKLWKNL